MNLSMVPLMILLSFFIIKDWEKGFFPLKGSLFSYVVWFPCGKQKNLKAHYHYFNIFPIETCTRLKCLRKV